MARFNGNAQYLVMPPKGKKETGYTRVSNVVKLPEDGNSLINWRVRKTMEGLMRRPDLQKMVEGHPDDKQTLDRIAEAALEASESSAGANSGTALHSVLHRWSLGLPDTLLPGTELLGDLDAVRAYFAIHRMRIVPGWTEQMVVHHKYKVAGTFDLLVDLSDTDDPSNDIVIADYKTTKEDSIRYAFGAWCIQEAAYATGQPYVQDPGPGQPRELEWPDRFNPKRGLVIHIPAGSGRVSVFETDLNAGEAGFKLGLAIREWRKRKDFVWTWPDKMMVQLEASVEEAIAAKVVAGADHAPDYTDEIEPPNFVPVPTAVLLTPVTPNFMPDKTIDAVVRGLPPLAPITPPDGPLPLLTPLDPAEPFTTPHEATASVHQARQAAMKPLNILDTLGTVAPVPVVTPVPLPKLVTPPLDLLATAPAPVQQELTPPAVTETLQAIEAEFRGTVIVETLTAEQLQAKQTLAILTVQLDGQLRSRLQYLKDNHLDVLTKLSTMWPVIDGAPVPTFTMPHRHTWEELQAIDHALTSCEGMIPGFPFPEGLPGDQTPINNGVVAPERPAIMAAHDAIRAKVAAVDDGPPVSDDDLDALARRLAGLDDGAGVFFKAVVLEAATGGWQMNARTSRRTRQWIIAKMMCFAYEAGIDEPNDLKSIIRYEANEDGSELDIPEEDVVGGLTIPQAIRVANQFDLMRTKRLELRFYEDTGRAFLETPF